MTDRVRNSRLRAELFTAKALEFQRLAEQARDDYARMRREYTERNPDMPRWVQDARFKVFTVVQDCVTDDEWYSRQARENSGAANMEYARQVRLLEELAAFLRARRSRVPAPRAG